MLFLSKITLLPYNLQLCEVLQFLLKMSCSSIEHYFLSLSEKDYNRKFNPYPNNLIFVIFNPIWWVQMSFELLNSN